MGIDDGWSEGSPRHLREGQSGFREACSAIDRRDARITEMARVIEGLRGEVEDERAEVERRSDEVAHWSGCWADEAHRADAAEAQRDAARANLASVTAERDAAWEVVAGVEWKRGDPDLDMMHCPWCTEYKGHGHAANCPLAAVLDAHK